MTKWAPPNAHLQAQVFKTVERAADGVTKTIWRDEAAAMQFAYRQGFHRTQVDRYKTGHAADRTSFIRWRRVRWDSGKLAIRSKRRDNRPSI